MFKFRKMIHIQQSHLPSISQFHHFSMHFLNFFWKWVETILHLVQLYHYLGTKWYVNLSGSGISESSIIEYNKKLYYFSKYFWFWNSSSIIFYTELNQQYYHHYIEYNLFHVQLHLALMILKYIPFILLSLISWLNKTIC